MSVRNLKDGSKKPWLCECYPQGREGKRVRKRFATKGEANAFELHTLKNVDDKPWLGEKVDNRKLSELINKWHELHGYQLTKSEKRLNKLKIFCDWLNDPIARKVTANDFAKYRQARVNGEIINGKGRYVAVQKTTVNVEQRQLSAVFSKLIELDEINFPNPLDKLKQLRVNETELSFLYPEEIPKLIDYCKVSTNDSLLPVVKICLATGCRWSEAETLRGTQIMNNRITFTKTKNMKNRTVPISQELADSLPKMRGRLFNGCENAFGYAIDKAGIKLPKGQLTHVLRHTFASHFMMNGGNILVLKNILGHSDIKMTMRYAHFAPTHLEDAVTKNPIAALL